jgi:creatinine amidohydrolase
VTHLLFHEATRTELRERANNTLAILPVGATEQHGPHLAVGTDFLTVEYLAVESAKKIASEISVVVAPTLPYGSSPHHLPFGGTLSLSTETYYRVLVDLLESLVTDGFQQMFILNGHGGNNELIQLAARDVALKHPVRIGAASYWTIARDELQRVNQDPDASLPGHAGIYETSQMLALHPELVKAECPARDTAERFLYSVTPPYRLEVHNFWQSFDGFTDSPARATAEQGRRYLDAVVGAVANALRDFYQHENHAS